MGIILYHTSDRLIDKPDVYHSRDYLDFGKGFYLTPLQTQAESYGLRLRPHSIINVKIRAGFFDEIQQVEEGAYRDMRLMRLG